MHPPLVSFKSPVTRGKAYFQSPDYNDRFFLLKAAKINLLFSSYCRQSDLRSVSSSRKMEIR
jgi:hypothetical protein